MVAYWPWGLMIAGLVTVTIWMNGHHWRAGWLIGAAAQVAQIGFGAATGIWTFCFAALPLVMFLWNWWQHPRREAERKRLAGGVLVDAAGGDQMIVMSRGVLEEIRETGQRCTGHTPDGRCKRPVAPGFTVCSVHVPSDFFAADVAAFRASMRAGGGVPWLPSPITPGSPLVRLTSEGGPGPEHGDSTAPRFFDTYAEYIAALGADVARHTPPSSTDETIPRHAIQDGEDGG